MSSGTIDLDGRLSLHPQFAARTLRVGNEGLPVIVIDHFLSRAELLIEHAASAAAFDGVSDSFYPGIRAPIPPIYCFAVRAFLGDLIAQTFGLKNSHVVGELAHYSLVTTPPARLSVPQRLPHIDNTNPRQLAVLHYLCGPQHGGTSFYRHRRTGFESVDDSRALTYRQALARELESDGPPPPAYLSGDSPAFERIVTFTGDFNRVLVYRSMNLHSADIGADFRFDADPRHGRLTANTFFYFSQSHQNLSATSSR